MRENNVSFKKRKVACFGWFRCGVLRGRGDRNTKGKMKEQRTKKKNEREGKER